jgi:sulfatase maturation enzyme AslB (radical SAM superfamily)
MRLLAPIKLKRRKLLRFDIQLTDHCNLNCKYCSTLSPIAEERFLDLAVFEKDLARLSSITGGELEDILLAGGESLLHRELPAIFTIARKYFKHCDITLLTNGILLLSQNDIFWKECNKNNIGVTITRYPIKLDIDSIKEKAQKHGVRFDTLCKGTRTFILKPLDITGRQNQNESFKLCYLSNRCIILLNGRIFPCATIANAHHFNKYFNLNLPVSEKDSIDIYKAKNKEEIFDFLCNSVPFCRYCNIKNTTFGLEWGVSEKSISEWAMP